MTNKTNLKNMNKGITLIALVITIIVLLILAGISIATLTGQNGVLTKASIAQEESKKAEYKEILELIGNGIKPEKTLEQLDTKTFMDRYEEKIREKIKEGENLEGANAERISDSIIRVITKEGYVYRITENEVTYLGKYGENEPPPDLQETDLDFILDPVGYTNQDVTIEIKSTINIDGYILQYSTDGINWTNYKEKIIFNENGTIHARLAKETGETGGVASKVIDTIERDLPNEANIVFSKSSVAVKEELKATVTQSDVGKSGLAIENCRYIFTTVDTPLGTDSSSYTGGIFTQDTEIITLDTNQLGDYYLHVLTVDKAGNKKETISQKVHCYQTTYYLQGSNTYNSITGGYTSKGVAPRSSGRNDFAYGTNSAWAKGNYYLGACRADSITVASTVKAIDLTNINTLYCDWLLYDDGAEKCRYGFGVSSSPCSATWAFNKYEERITTDKTQMSSFETISLDVSDLKGSYYIRLHCERVYTSGTDSDGATWHTCYLGFKNIYGR